MKTVIKDFSLRVAKLPPATLALLEQLRKKRTRPFRSFTPQSRRYSFSA